MSERTVRVKLYLTRVTPEARVVYRTFRKVFDRRTSNLLTMGGAIAEDAGEFMYKKLP